MRKLSLCTDALLAALLLASVSLSACALVTGSARAARAKAECDGPRHDTDTTSTGRSTTSEVICHGGQPTNP